MSEEALGEQFSKVYHLTSRAKFKPSATFRPQNNTTLGGSSAPGLYVTDSPERWINGYGYARPFVAEMTVPKELLSGPTGYSGEKHIPAESLGQVQVDRVIPTDAHAREKYGSHGWIEGRLGKQFDDHLPITAKPWETPFKDYRYEGPDVREMAPEQVRDLKSQARSVQKDWDS